MKQGLTKLKAKLLKLLNNVEKSLELIETREDGFEPKIDCFKSSVQSQCKELKKAIEAEDFKCIVERAKEYKEGDGTEGFADALTKSVNDLASSKTLNIFARSLEEFNMKYEPL
eukprot:TRINITY_DN9427_c0_g1_i11.p4 TRINITY_DN9427_c0_g1~~TRINITY_DN9427_c0_g1_i11.p4  ORF type:complete len:114 (+),score=18.02 TRINITY_DN9427_c0_g1_i11:417-758(+)